MQSFVRFVGPVVLMCAILAAPALADYKWIQEPDLSMETGLNVDVTYNFEDMYLLADDFLCTQTGPLTEICIWGSWAHDEPPMLDPHAVEFTLAIHADIPAEANPDGYSMPGEVLWIQQFIPGDFTVLGGLATGMKGWFSPPGSYWYPCCEIAWEYCFPLDEIDTFVQQGTPAEPLVYWLAVQASPLVESDKSFGWLASLDHWNDDGVWITGLEPIPDGWSELVYPSEHLLAGQSIDLAFNITGEGGNDGMDWGDAPDPAYPTLGANNGAWHIIVPNFLMGPSIDSEADGQPDATATGDDIANLADEDGVTFVNALSPGGPAMVRIDMTASTVGGFINAWIDFDANGNWIDPGDQILSGQWVAAGAIATLNFTVPPTAAAGSTFARFRLSSVDMIPCDGPADDGEVEDYEVFIEGGGEEWKWEQLPDLGTTGIDVNCSAPFVLADDFLCEEQGRLTLIQIWGSWLNDYLPFGEDPLGLEFTLSIHADIPATASSTGYSMPGEVLWVHDFMPGEFMAEIWRDEIEEGWMDPPEMYIFPADWTCWLYTFEIPPSLAFLQSGLPEEPVVYWLDVQARPFDVEALFGWKTSLDHWNDDAVWGMGSEPYPGPWDELVYPPMHEMAGQSIDLAFRIFNDPMSSVSDEAMPRRHSLRQNVPNPFNPQTVLEYDLSVGGSVRVDVFDSRGRHLRGLVNEVQGIGAQSVVWDGRDSVGQALPSGVYFYRLRAPGCDETMKMVLVR